MSPTNSATEDGGLEIPSASHQFKTPERSRLTDAEKKSNHISSEKRRRANVRNGYAKLCDLVPGLQGYSRSEGVVVWHTVQYIIDQINLKNSLISQLEENGVNVANELRIYRERTPEPIEIEYSRKSHNDQSSSSEQGRSVKRSIKKSRSSLKSPRM
ncbi:MAG: hypothetical protein Q9167_002510 [Letrouitia subvulpina]